MSVNSHLMAIADAALVRDVEKASIQRSIDVLQERLDRSFGKDISDHFIFGSYSRGTILPRVIDDHSDIDFMVVFNDADNRPQTYLDKLRRFVDACYAKSEIAQSSPAIVLSLNHINFDLVPAVKSMWYGLRIPARTSSGDDWVSTDPKDLNDKLSRVNAEYQNLIKPLVRVMKYWNAKNNYPFDSFDLEQKVIGSVGSSDIFPFLVSSPRSLNEHFFHFAEEVGIDDSEAQWKQDLVRKLKDVAQGIRFLEERKCIDEAEAVIENFLPLWS